jgi:SAM-dependent methyltransferase
MQYYPALGNDIGSTGWNHEVAKIIAYCDGEGIDIGAGDRTINKDMVTVDIDPEVKANITAPGDAVPVPDGSFDYVVSIHSLEHFEDQDKALKEWLRIIKPGGYICIVHPDIEFTKRCRPGIERPAVDRGIWYEHKHDRTFKEFLEWINLRKKWGYKIVSFGEACCEWSFYFVLKKSENVEKDKIINQAKKIQGWMMDVDLSGLYDLSEQYLKAGDVALEVGSWKGRSSYVIASVCKEKGAKLVCIDTFIGSENNEEHYKEALDMGSESFMTKNIKKNLEGLPAEYICENSTTAHKKIKDGSVALCFIDGNHCDPVISQDLDNYWPKVKSGGIFACHDYSRVCPDVVMAIDKKFIGLDGEKKYLDIIAFKKT